MPAGGECGSGCDGGCGGGHGGECGGGCGGERGGERGGEAPHCCRGQRPLSSAPVSVPWKRVRAPGLHPAFPSSPHHHCEAPKVSPSMRPAEHPHHAPPQVLISRPGAPIPGRHRATSASTQEAGPRPASFPALAPSLDYGCLWPLGFKSQPSKGLWLSALSAQWRPRPAHPRHCAHTPTTGPPGLIPESRLVPQTTSPIPIISHQPLSPQPTCAFPS